MESIIADNLQRIDQSVYHALQAPDLSSLDRGGEVRIENAPVSDPGNRAAPTERRELLFLLSHSTHHHTLIAMICRPQGVTMADEFGVAPSALKYRQRSQTSGCVQ